MGSFKIYLLTTLCLYNSSVVFASTFVAAGGAGEPELKLNAIEQLEAAKTQPGSALKTKDVLTSLRQSQTPISIEDYRHLKGSSALQLTGTEYLQQRGVTGEGLTIWVLEDAGTNDHPDVEKYVDSSSDKKMAADFTQKQGHGSAMVSLIHQVAPKATLVLKHLKETLASEMASTSLATCPHIINASFDLKEGETLQSYFGFIRHDSRLGWRTPLLVKAAGNHQENLTTNPSVEGMEPDLLKYLIFAGNLRQDSRPTTSSGVPGNNPALQNRFLWVIADDVRVASGSRGAAAYRYTSGTSNAASILSGAAAMLKSAFPSFTMDQIAECLLESAVKDFFGYFGDGHHAIHVVPEGTTEGTATTMDGRVVTQIFDPAIWGKGILNLKNAYRYAHIKLTNPTLSSQEIRLQMDTQMMEEKTVAASKLKEAFKARKIKRGALLPLNIDQTVPDRSYEEAEGNPGEPSAPDTSPQEAAAALGIKTEDIKVLKAPPAKTALVQVMESGEKSFDQVLKETSTDVRNKFSPAIQFFKNNPGILNVMQAGQSFAQYLIKKYLRNWHNGAWQYFIEKEGVATALLDTIFSPYLNEQEKKDAEPLKTIVRNVANGMEQKDWGRGFGLLMLGEN